MAHVEDANMRPSYEYNDLNISRNEIRLFSVMPGVEADDIQIYMTSTSLDYPLPYDALSYAWHDDHLFPGDKGQTSEVLIVYDSATYLQDSAQVPCLAIGKNLAAYLRAHRKSERKGRLLWVDAICINQGSMEERNVQVLRMTNIYQTAQKAIVWLGPTGKESGLAVDFIETLTDRWQRNDYMWTAADHEWFKKSLTTGEHLEEWRALVDLLGRAWWERLWTVQEIVLARDSEVVCGDTTIMWSRFRELYLVIDQNLNTILGSKEEQGAVGTLQHLNKIITRTFLYREQKQNRTCDLLQILNLTRIYVASDPLDKIYGVLGLAKDAERIMPKPDYSLSIDRLLQSLVIAMIDSHQNLDFLSLVSLHRLPMSKPSWFPDPEVDFRNEINSSLIPKASRTIMFNAAQESTPCAQIVDDLKVLMLRGFQLDVIRDVGSASKNRQVGLPRISSPEITINESDKTAFSAIWRALVAGPRFSENSVTYEDETLGELFAMVCTARDEELTAKEF